MSKLFSPSTMGFYDTGISTFIPADAIEITAELHERLVMGPSQGMHLELDGQNQPVLVKDSGESESLAVLERRWRDAELSRHEWLVTRHRDDREMGLEAVLTEEQFSELLVFRRALRDWPESALFPKSEYRPTEPEWLAAQLAPAL